MPIAEQLTGRRMVQPVPGAPTNVDRWGHERGAGLHGAGMYATVPMREGDGEGQLKRVSAEEREEESSGGGGGVRWADGQMGRWQM